MKTIAVLTDFSDSSEHAAGYALHLAQKIKADLLLFNACITPASIPLAAAQTGWPDNQYEAMKEDASQKLTKLADKLKRKVKTRPLPGTFLPSIVTQCEESPLINAVSELEKNPAIVLLVAGSHHTDLLTTFIQGNNCHALIESVTLPLLLIPQGVSAEPIRKIVFASDLHTGDAKFLRSLCTLAHHYAAGILVTNVSPDKSPAAAQREAENLFREELDSAFHNEQVDYSPVKGGSVPKGLDVVLEKERPDLLVMVHRKKDALTDFFKRSMTKRIASGITVPLLIYPYPAADIRQF